MRIAVIGHVEHITLGRVIAIPQAGDIAHVQEPRTIAGGGGGIAFFQLTRADAEIHLFSALGDDDAAATVERAIGATDAVLHLARRPGPHTRDVVMIGPDGERTIVVIGEPLHPRLSDDLPWELLDGMDAVYFTAQDPALLARARIAKHLVVAARRRECVIAANVPVDVIVGSRADPREVAMRADFPIMPDALVMTEGANGGTIETATGVSRFASTPVAEIRGAYGAGDSFAGALTYWIARGMPIEEAAAKAAGHGAAVLANIDPLAAQLALS